MRMKPPRHRLVLSVALALVGAAATLGAFAACRVSEITPAANGASRANLRATDTATVTRTQPVVTTAVETERAPEKARAAAALLAADGAPPRARVTRTPTDSALAMKLDAAAHPAALRPGHVNPAGAPPPPAPRAASDGGEKPYFEFRVTRPAVPAPGNSGPRYPEILRDAKVEGEVLAQFVVDTGGRMLPGSFKVLRSDHALFTEAVRQALESASFIPAEVEGRKVRQLLQMPFQFQLTK